MGGTCWNGWTLLDFVVLWVCVLEALGLIFEVFLVAGVAK